MTMDGAGPGCCGGAEMVREAAARAPRRPVLLLDEFDDLEQKVRSGRLSPEVFDQMRALIQHGDALAFVLAGTHRLEELAGEYWWFLMNLATYCRVGPLAPADAAAVIRTPLENMGVVCEDAAAAAALSLTGCQPYLLQLLGYRLVEMCVREGIGGVGWQQVSAAGEEVVEQGEIHLRYLWETAGANGQAVLSLLARHGGWAEGGEVARQLGWPRERLGKALQRLRAQDLVTEAHGWIRLRVGLLGKWLSRQ